MVTLHYNFCEGAAVGAGGATAYYNKDAFGDSLRAAITPSWLSQSGSSTSSKGPQLDELSRMVQQLSLDVQRRNGAVTIVHGSDRGCGACGRVHPVSKAST